MTFIFLIIVGSDGDRVVWLFDSEIYVEVLRARSAQVQQDKRWLFSVSTCVFQKQTRVLVSEQSSLRCYTTLNSRRFSYAVI